MQSREPRRYLAAAAGELVRQAVSEAERPFEFMLNALRLVEGFTRAAFEERTGLAWQVVDSRLERAACRGLIEARPGGWRPSAQGLQFLNELLLEFLPETPKKKANSYMSMLTSEVP